MGALCATPKTDEATRAMDKKMKQEKESDKHEIKLLFLGAGGSGKSTLFKQLKKIHGGGVSNAELGTYKDIVYHNIVDSMKTLCEKSMEFGENEPKFKIDPSLQDVVSAVMDKREDTEVDVELADQLSKLWADKGIRATYDNRFKFYVLDCIEYFMNPDILKRIAARDYKPTFEDVLHVRLRTSGIVEHKFTLPKNPQSPFRVVDVGGQRSERNKWIHVFDGVTAIVFVASLSAYDEVLFEDQRTNRMVESLKVFKEVCLNKIFADKSIILFLNKRDIFENKIKTRPLSITFQECQVDTKADPEKVLNDSMEFVKELFLYQHAQASDELEKTLGSKISRKVHTHFVTATDTNLVKTIFDDVQQIVIQKSFELAGLM